MRPHRDPPRPFARRRAGVMLAAAVLVAGAVRASGRSSIALERVPPVVLTDETGRQVRLYDDLVKDHVVAMSFIFTTCSTVCQPMSATFSHLQSLIGSRPVRLVSVSIDPGTDTPRRLAEWKARFHGGPAWTLLTGSKEEIDRLRKALGVYTPDKLSHSATVVVIDDIHQRSTRVSGLAPARTIIEAIDSLSSASPGSAR
jgi:protein SCO1/2